MSQAFIQYCHHQWEQLKPNLSIEQLQFKQALFENLQNLAPFSNKHEAWKYLRFYDLEQFLTNYANHPQAPSKVSPLPKREEETYRIVFRNSKWSEEESFLPKDLGISIRFIPDILFSESLNSLDLMQAANHLLAMEVLHIELDPYVELDKPLYCVWHYDGISTHFPKKQIKLGHHAKLVWVEEFIGTEETFAFIDESTQIELAPEAHLQHTIIEKHSLGTLHFAHHTIVQHQQSHFDHCLVQMGAQLHRAAYKVNLVGTGAAANMYGVYLPAGKQQHNVHIEVEHQADHCTSQQTFKGIVAEQGKGIFNSVVTVYPDAVGSHSRQFNPNLLLSKLAEVYTRPQLKIDHDNVKCSHGSTVGRLDEQAMFYLQSRGISKEQARGLLTFAFARDIFEYIPLEGLRHTIQEEFKKRFAVGQD